MNEADTRAEIEESVQGGDANEDITELTSGVITGLGSLPSATLLTEDGLAGIMGKSCRESIKRAVARGELPPPVKIMGKNAWTVSSIVRHIEERLESERNKVSRSRV